MSKIIIMEGNSSDKDIVRTYMIKGEKGEKGDKGDQGTIADNSLTIGTVTSGTTASAEITGTSPNQILNLVLPKGDKGDKGDTGEVNTVNEYSTSTTNAYSSDFINGTVLYEGTTHVTSGTLSDYINNYKRIKIWAVNTDDVIVFTEILPDAQVSGTSIVTTLWSGSFSAGQYTNSWYFKSARLIFTKDGNTFSLDREYGLTVGQSGGISTGGSTWVIQKIVGYEF